MHIDITDRVVAVTGAGRGLGRALGEGLAVEGARVALITRTLEQAEKAAAEITAAHPGVPEPMALAADVADEGQVAGAIAAIDQRWGRIDGFINNAGWMPPVTRTRLIGLDTDALRQVIDANLIGPFLTTKHVAPVMVRGGGGRIVYITSMLGVQANPGQAPYGATKAGVNILANVAHRELADQGIRTVALAPGLTDTPGMRLSVDGAYIDKVAATYPGGRLGLPEDIVSFVTFLCSDAAQHISGTVLPVRPVTG